MTNRRSLALYALLTVITICLGLLSRSHYVSLPDFVSGYAGDSLWALMVFLIICIFARQMNTWSVSLLAILFSFAIELSQLYQAPWLNSIRHTFPFGLILGYGFKPSDLACYTVGVSAGTFIDLLIKKLKDK